MSGSNAPTTPVCYIDQLGIHAPSFATVLTYLQQQYRSIYGQDVYLGNDSQDGQFLGLLALAISDTNSAIVGVYGAFSPATAQGLGLSSVVKINGIHRLVPTNSAADLTLVGQNGTPINNGIVQDQNGVNWLLPALVTIPPSGTVIATALCAVSGAINAPAGSINVILTPTRGWQTATNLADAVAGDPLESDPSLRQRQTVSTALPSTTVGDGILGSVASIPGVLRYVLYDNDTNVTDKNGIPSKNIALVVDGGDATQIAIAIQTKKTPGTPTYGTTTEVVNDTQGLAHTINFFRPTLVPISVAITINPLTGFTTPTETLIVNAIATYITGLSIGTSVLLTRLYTPANMADPAPFGSSTFNVTSLGISRSGTPSAQDVAIAFNEVAVCATANITLTVLVN